MMKSKIRLDVENNQMKKLKTILAQGQDRNYLISHEPKETYFELGNSLAILQRELESNPLLHTAYLTSCDELQAFRTENITFADVAQLSDLTCPQAIKRWAYERLPSQKIPYELTNRLTPDKVEETADEDSSLKILELAEDFMLIAGFCRDVQALQLNMAPHASGMEFIFEYLGTPTHRESRRIEDKGMATLFKRFAKENSMKLRWNVSDEYIELQAIVIRKRYRMGLSPMD